MSLADVGLSEQSTGLTYEQMSQINVGSQQLTPGPSKAETFRLLGSVGLDLDSNGIRAAYLDYFSNLSDSDFDNPAKRNEALDLLKVGIELWGDPARPKQGWGIGNNHTDPYFVNMIKVIQATLGLKNTKGEYNGKYNYDMATRICRFFPGFRGVIVGLALIRRLKTFNYITAIRALIARAAASLAGAKYILGREDSEATDCSGTVYFSYNTAGIKLIRTTAEGYFEMSTEIDRSQLQPGDIIAYWNPTPNANGDHYTHIQVYIGDAIDFRGNSIHDAVINAGSEETGVRILSLRGYETWAANNDLTPHYGRLLGGN